MRGCSIDLLPWAAHGGVIAVDPGSHIAWAGNTELMFRAKASDLQGPVIAIFNGKI